ncbi:AI-2E family transporter [Stieleria sp. JC731]|uniref:AI-2E family transporter n=1 Tax=Pirellulaceae TaxID=2691357 RepID=UPI001E28D76B|nr:AI-2E family transporter [Stieleria sp. JC731]MCC9602760.1 AI-2E family transporter [Stieleria sp. JC731]
MPDDKGSNQSSAPDAIAKPKRLPSAKANIVCASMLVLYALYFARTLIIPILIAAFAYLTLRPLVRRGRHLGIPSSVASGLILGTSIVITVIPAYLVMEPARQTLDQAPEYVDNVKERLSFVFNKLDAVSDATTKLAEEEREKDISEAPVPVEIKQPNWNANLTFISGTGNFVSLVIVTIVLLYFLLAFGDDLIRNMLHTLPDFRTKRNFFAAIDGVQDGLSLYLAHVTTINIILGVCVSIAMWLLGMPTPLLWGVMACVFNFVPVLGAFAGSAIIFVVALLTFDPLYYAIIITSTFLMLTTIEGQFITPTVLGRSMQMNPVLVFIATVFWGWMWGLAGVLLSVPILIAIRMASEHYECSRGIAEFLGGKRQSDEEKQNRRVPDPGLAIGLKVNPDG